MRHDRRAKAAGKGLATPNGFQETTQQKGVYSMKLQKCFEMKLHTKTANINRQPISTSVAAAKVVILKPVTKTMPSQVRRAA